jgi:tRNA1(Val) A37 N6-methylase TrmN6
VVRKRGSALELAPSPEETLDSICGGKVQVLQKKAGYRFNLDPILLAHFARDGGQRGPAIDLGTGSGIIPLVLAKKFHERELTGLELQPDLFALAQRNVHLNRVERRLSLVLGDLRRVNHLFQRGSFARVLGNPPYGPPGAGRVSPDRERALARHGLTCSVQDVAKASAHLLRPRGALFLVYPSARMLDLLCTLREKGLEPRRLRLVHPREGRPAKLVLVEAIKDAKPQMIVEPPLYLHGAKQGFTEEVQAMIE